MIIQPWLCNHYGYETIVVMLPLWLCNHLEINHVDCLWYIDLQNIKWASDSLKSKIDYPEMRKKTDLGHILICLPQVAAN